MKTKIFLGIETILYIRFLWMDLFESQHSNGSSFIKFAGIVLCLFYLFTIPKDESNKADLKLMRRALTFTVFADFFILILEIYEPGLICFLVVQICYLMRVRAHKPSKWYLTVGLCSTVVVIIFIFDVTPDYLLLLSSFYAICIVRNVIETIVNYNQVSQKTYQIKSQGLSKSQSKLFMLGMLFFLFCDISVGINNMGLYFEQSALYEVLIQFAVIGMWFFYLPSQVMLALSVVGKKS